MSHPRAMGWGECSRKQEGVNPGQGVSGPLRSLQDEAHGEVGSLRGELGGSDRPKAGSQNREGSGEAGAGERGACGVKSRVRDGRGWWGRRKGEEVKEKLGRADASREGWGEGGTGVSAEVLGWVMARTGLPFT